MFAVKIFEVSDSTFQSKVREFRECLSCTAECVTRPLPEREVSVMRQLKNEHIVRYFGSEMKDNHLLLFMELATSSLTHVIRGFGGKLR